MKMLLSAILATTALISNTSTASALSPECTQLTFFTMTKPGVGGTRDGTYLRWFKFGNDSRLHQFGSGTIKKDPGDLGFTSSTAAHSVGTPNGAGNVFIYEYDNCSIERDSRGNLRRVSISFRGDYHRNSLSSPAEPASVTLSATRFSRASYGFPAGADARYFQNLSYSVTLPSDGSSPIAGEVTFNSASSGGTANGTGIVWLNQPEGWPY